MNSLENLHVSDSRETVEAESHYNTFDVLMSRVDTGELTFPEAIEAYKRAELSPETQEMLASTALRAS